MKIVKIKNKFMFRSRYPNKEHTYLHYYDRKSKETRLIETTHLYELSENKKTLINNGVLKEFKFKDLYLPSGVNNHYYSTDIKGNKLKYKSKNYKIIGTIPNKQAKKIIRFANRKRK